ncbi:MAG TPA: hypothetical protein VF519_02265 [Mycobacteriales bacterium]|jgi:hypothetical protein
MFRAMSQPSLSRHHLHGAEVVSLDVTGTVVERSPLDGSTWVTGVVARNPFAGQTLEHGGEAWPLRYYDSQFLVCDLRSHHPTRLTSIEYRLVGWESTTTADALVLRPIADSTGILGRKRAPARADSPTDR